MITIHLGTKKAFGYPALVVLIGGNTVVLRITEQKWETLWLEGLAVEG